MSLPCLVVTGASGFVGRHLLDALKEDYRIVGLARRSQARSGAPVHPNITWHQADIGDRAAIEPIFEGIRHDGGADILIHLAAHYDFTGEEHPEYERTNVQGLRNVLELAKPLGLKRFIFPSSTAACRFPAAGEALTEGSPPDGDHIYARTKAKGERMLAEYRDYFPSTIVRFAALFSDWCEYPPLFMFLETWLSSAWNARMLGGRGQSAIPVPPRGRPHLLLPRAARPARRGAAGPGAAGEPGRGRLAPAALRRGDAPPLREQAGVAPHAASPLRPGHVEPRPPGPADRQAALRAALDGALHRPRHDASTPAGRDRSSGGSLARASRSCGACPSSSRTARPTRSSGTAPTARR